MTTPYPNNDLSTDKALYVRELQHLLCTVARADSRVPAVDEDGVFGAQTTAAVKAAQACAHLPVTGQVDNATWRAVVRAAAAAEKETEPPLPVYPYAFDTPPLCEGDQNAAVAFAQGMFNALCDRFCNFEKEPPSGVMTDVTCRNVRTLQHAFCCRSTGTLDCAAWNELATAYTACVTDCPFARRQ